MKEAKQKRIGEHKYIVRYLKPTSALRMFTQIVKTIAPSLGHAADGLLKGQKSLEDALDADIKELSIAAVVEALALRLDENMIVSMVEELAAITAVEIDGKQPELDKIFDIHFAGRFGEMLKWLGFALEVNFGDFLSGSKGLAQKGRDLLARIQGSQSPSTSVGPCGESSPHVSPR